MDGKFVNGSTQTRHPSAYLAALRMLAQRRLTEAQLWQRLERKGHGHDDVRVTVERCKREGYIDDRLFAQLYVEQKVKAVGNVRLVGELVRKGIDRDAAHAAVQQASAGEQHRLDEALAKILRTKSGVSYQSAARTLERLGFPTALIYRVLREHARLHGPFAADAQATGGEQDNLCA